MISTLKRLFLKMIGGTRNDRVIRSLETFVRERINPLEPETAALSDEQILEKSAELRRRLADGENRLSVRAEAFALVREATRRALGIRLFDVQLVAGMVLDNGWIAEEATGEGKTFACYPAIFMAALEGMHTHVVTTNDYLVRVGAEFAAPVFARLGVTVGHITSGMSPSQRRPAYACDITYGSNNEFGFDYLRDNTKLSVSEQVQGALDFAIIDEVDSILIDEARTPLILSGPSHGETARFGKADAVARELIRRNRPWDQANRRVESLRRDLRSLEGEKERRGEGAEDLEEKIRHTSRELAEAEGQLAGMTKYYEVELDRKAAYLTHEGVTVAQETAGVGSFYTGANLEWPHLMENALRAHVVYQKDKEYVVQDGKVVIVDEFTGRLMEGREWSNGLHQAVEAKENVPVKQENQTMATVTIQNFFKMYRKLAGMTGTAMTEANEFLKIYKLDVAAVPTHRPVNRMDYEDRIYATPEAKFEALVEEINAVSKAGRPVLVGTTSVEKSELISEMLTRRWGVDHEVLNARPEHAAREADIVAEAGMQRPLKPDSKERVGNVTIATNMAGRGTDIKLGEGVVCGSCRVPSAEKLAELGVELDPLYPPGVNKCCVNCQQYDGAGCAHCFKPRLDEDFPRRGRTSCPLEMPCGLHIVGTERHESRRIDNQLRGRAGRQGDPGSSRFFLSIRDELMATFAGDWTVKVLGWLGLTGDAAIEDKRISKGVERAQRKVEERNFEIRKHVLEYDEVMDYQRREYYRLRQQVLEGRELQALVRGMIEEVIDEGVRSYLDGNYHRRCIAEWARAQLQVSVEPAQIEADAPAEQPALEQQLRQRAREEAANSITVSLGEYMSEEEDPEHWDLKGLSSWAMSRFSVNISQNQLRKMQPEEVEERLIEAAGERIEQIDLGELGRFLQPDFARASLAEWARSKFDFELNVEDIDPEVDVAVEQLQERAEQAYRRREIEYPVEYALDRTVNAAGWDNVYALGDLAGWANRKFQAGLSVEALQQQPPARSVERLYELAREWNEPGRIERAVREAVGEQPDPQEAIAFARDRFAMEISPEQLDGDAFEVLADAGRRFLRREMTELERFVLLQIFDTSWIDHLLAMDHLRDAIGLRSVAEQDPRVAFKREGSKLFAGMLQSLREKVTDLIFKVRLSRDTQMTSAYQISGAVHEQLSAYDGLEGQSGAAGASSGPPQKVETIRRDIPRVGRNDPCPCGSGKKYKKCCGAQ